MVEKSKKMQESGKSLFILSFPDVNSGDFRKLLDFLRPYARDKNILLTSQKIKPVSAVQYRKMLEAMLKEAKDHEKLELARIKAQEKKVVKQTPEQKAMLKKMKEKTIKSIQEDAQEGTK